MSESLITRETKDSILFVTINRPEKRNALTPEMVHELADAVQSADNDPTVRAVIVSGAGPMFSAGVDVFALAQARAECGARNAGRWLRRLADRLQDSFYRIESTEVPVIGALHGKVLGLGVEVALAFDLRVASNDLELSIPEARLGLVADVGGTTRLARTVGPSRAKDLLMTSRSIDAAEALSWGLVNRVVSPGEVIEGATALVRQIVTNAPLAVGMAKLIIDQGDGLDKHTQMAIERWAQSQLITTEDALEAVSAFAEKRPAKFKGA